MGWDGFSCWLHVVNVNKNLEIQSIVKFLQSSPLMRANAFQGKRVAVFGLGRSGLATCRALTDGGADVVAWDDNEAGRKAALDAGFNLVDLHTIDWSMHTTLVLSPGVPLTHPQPHWCVELARAAGIEIIGDVEVFARERAEFCPNAPFVAVTGTNGKSTTTALIAHLLRAVGRDVQMGGNIGVPILDLASPALSRIHVIELSSYQIDLMPTLSPSIGILMNISPDHLDRHGTFENYANIKARVPASAAHAIIGVDDAPSRAIFEKEQAKGKAPTAISSGALKNGTGVESSMIVHRHASDHSVLEGQRELIAGLDGIVSLRGRHNAQNAAAAAAACLYLGLTSEEIRAGLVTFPGLPHRLEQLGRSGNVIFVNDSKATNAESTEHALNTFDSNIYWIAGGCPKDGGIASLSDYFPRIAKAYLIGEAAPAFAQTLNGRCAVEECGTLETAVAHAASDAKSSTGGEAVVLLSPACASFDQFRNFEVRGDAFRALVSRLPNIAMQRGE